MEISHKYKVERHFSLTRVSMYFLFFLFLLFVEILDMSSYNLLYTKHAALESVSIC